MNAPLKLHLGCGKKYFDGFINVDSNIFQKSDMWLDVRQGLPFPSETVEFIYTSNFLEHFYTDESDFILRECLRVLKKEGGMRIVAPNLENAIRAYINNQLDWFSDWPIKYASAGGRFSNLVFCHGQHRNTFDFSYLEEILRHVGFLKIIKKGNGESEALDSRFLDMHEIENDQHRPRYLYVEAFK